MKLKLVIEGNPVSASRPGFNSKSFKRKAYTKGKYRVYKNNIEILYWDKYHNKQLFERGIPLIAHIHFYRPIQKSLSKVEHARRANHEVRPTIKPDLDNYTKGVLDGLKRAWFDDGQITDFDISKDYDEHPRVEVEIEEWKFEQEERSR
ncbi:RusA family crossover junction endodeoxyribonuclease [Companilactobacillus pabuli]|jgi:Holliday junction resolvase RusA-like endonuclease|uniref:RusA family crossover junction endodeoxyribonuclease n=1 Tax=Companilactobacillus pabuli TaxID=2714036 RepID=A0A7L7KZK9_9LACO|nr:RusA family crossover junction endodeoxyribonuclease [Companilactobacillus pabuli]QMT84228.1 RusA family crossover junction endodeoxyribonuclease [Companilactobacillus pabuli]